MKLDPKCRCAFSLLQTGQITAGEAVKLAGTSRQNIRNWLKAEGIDWRKVRKKYIGKLWRKYQLKELTEI